MKDLEEQIISDINYYIDTVLGDLDLLLPIADKIAIEEFEDNDNNGNSCPPPTTSRSGNGYEPHQYISSRCTVPISMICFTAMDFIGKLITEDLEMKQNKNDFAFHSDNFLQKLLKNDSLKNPNKKDIIQNVYRNSIMHGFLPATTVLVGYSIAYSKRINDYSLFDSSFKNEVIFNVKYLAELVINGLSKLRKHLNSNDPIFKLIITNYKTVIKTEDEDYRNYKEIKP
jgi:hypothetical protein